jgi:lipopolysaccharide export system ATP-binding protein
MPLLECVGLVKDYPEKRAIDHVDFHVEQGEIVGIVGREGAGKTTAYRLVCGLVSPTDGRVLFNGVDVADWMPDRRQLLGVRFIARDVSVYRTMTVEQALLANSQPLEMNPKRRSSQANELLTQFGLDSRRNAMVGSLSIGEQRRLEIARCLVGKPSLVVLDEPFEPLDLVTTHSIRGILSDASQRGLSVLLTDHRGRDILRLTHRTYVLCDGRVIASGNAVAVLGNPIARRSYFGEKNLKGRFR